MPTAPGLPQLRPLLARLAAREHVAIVALGDSNTCNASFTDGAKQWPELLHQELRDGYGSQAITMVNVGICGDAVPECLARFDRDVARHRPDLTIVCLGSNDSGRLGDDAFRSGMIELLDRIAALGSLALLRTPTPIVEMEPAPKHLWRQDDRLRALVGVTRALARERGVALVDTYGEWLALEQQGRLDCAPLYCDAVHTNAAGHQLVFRGLAPAFGLDGSFMWERAAKAAKI